MNNLKPRPTSLGFNIAHLSNQTIHNYCQFWEKRNGKLPKIALAFKAIAENPGITTDEVRLLANHYGNVSDGVRAMKKKLMNKGLMVECVKPFGVAPNEAFHHWYLVEAPIMNVPVQMAVNDPIM
ncbi:hypothetical protein [Enterovibrio norvegicus]|uniref:hypothetical protein n=1 Tax=Enterovibrio norvegicus TaxID=188144 RepID=UPI0010BEA337|nr:hypothetical protein [Enterovibrio norvegicus]TKF29260.1 hypothetical protein FCV83_22250 [Enterovibrio norvegicus]